MSELALETPQANASKRGGAHNRGAKHMQPRDYVDILRWHDQGLSQQEIATRLGRPNSQGQISKAIRELSSDTRPEAKQILAAKAASMALNITENGTPKDHVNVMKGIGVTEEAQNQGLTVIVGGDATVNIGVLVGPLSPPHLQVVSEDTRNP